jgi:L-alanine-DL-glutamate epimerase-like enolase superfamily enzyme
MSVDRRTFTKSLTAGVVGSLVPGLTLAAAARARTPAALARAQARLPPAIITRIRIFYPPNYNPNGPQAFPQSNMVVLVDTDAGITGIGQGGSPDTVRNVARSVIGKNAFDTEMIWQAAYMDGFYSPGKERLHALGAIDLALWDIKGKALNAPLYQLFGGKAREHIELYATSGLPQGVVPPAEAAAMGLKERAAATMAAGYRVYRVDGGILPSTGRAAGAGAGRGVPAAGPGGAPAAGGRAGAPGGGGGTGRGRGGSVFDSRSRIRLIIEAVQQIRDGVGPDGNWMIDLHQKFDFHEAVEVCRLMEPYRPFCVEDPLREEQFRTQIPKLRLMTSVPLAPGEEWGTRWEFSPLVEQRDIDFARASLPNVGGITEMLKIMALCDTHKVGIVPHFTGPIATAGHMHTMMAFPGQVLMEYNQGDRPVPYMPDFLDCKNGKVWPNDRPGLGISVDEKQLKFIEEMTEGGAGPTHRRLDGSLTHW